ncbi:hypothetical protein J437_LFUL005753 [Ladona fulva]|uniref:Uncharacterized protein n=1 Tax=Ladona fulva TaxID=123851 RepID=A0A8K0K1M3_LADFU|nr:hypothetical protein J437_LFUL005753 [Ladona fulva]
MKPLCDAEEIPLSSHQKRFWELEESMVQVAQSPEEVKSEELLTKTHRRNASGKHTVSLSFRSELPSLGESYFQAEKSCINMEPTSSGLYHLPHHGVHKSTPQGPKLRDVFDASSRSSNGKSLKVVLLTGPKL